MKALLKDQKGIALFLVLWVLTLLSVIAGEFCFAMKTEVNITRNFKEQTEAYYIALAGANRAIAELIKNEVVFPQKASVTGLKKEDNVEAEEGKNRWRINVDIPPETYGQGQYRVRLGNESGKININGANEGLLRMMLNAFELEEKEKDIIVDSILDWRDKDELHRTNGAESDYYQSLPEPYACKNGDFDSVEELLLVRGVTPEIFYGGLMNMVTAFKAEEKGAGVGQALRSVRADVGRININAAPRQLLMALPSMTEDLVQQIVDYRKGSDFTSLSQLSPLVGSDVYARISPYVTVENSPYFTIRSVGEMMEGGIRQGVEAMVEIDKKSKKGYRIVQWRDSLRDQQADASDPEENTD